MSFCVVISSFLRNELYLGTFLKLFYLTILVSMEFLLDDPHVEQKYQEILRRLIPLQNGVVSESMEARGVKYKVNLGASVVSLKNLASHYDRNHLLALKLWNKGWRETLLLSTMLEVPSEVSSNQADYWVKNFESLEMAEQACMNLFPYIPYAHEKALEWCKGKKKLTKITGILLIRRLAQIDENVPDEKWEEFLSMLETLSKDAELSSVLVRTVCQIGRRNHELKINVLSFVCDVNDFESKAAREVAREIMDELEMDF